MSGKNTAVFGIYPTPDSADAAVDTLRTKGFRSTDISVLFPQNFGSKEFGHEKGTKSAEGAVAGGGTGAVIGGALGWLAGIGMLAIPGVGPFIAAGPIVAALAGMGAGGAIGGVTGALIGLGIPEYQAKRYEGRMRKGGILLSVHADNQRVGEQGQADSRTDRRRRHLLDGRDERRLREHGPPNRPGRACRGRTRRRRQALTEATQESSDAVNQNRTSVVAGVAAVAPARGSPGRRRPTAADQPCPPRSHLPKPRRRRRAARHSSRRHRVPSRLVQPSHPARPGAVYALRVPDHRPRLRCRRPAAHRAAREYREIAPVRRHSADRP